jgi:hypothetical protein
MLEKLLFLFPLFKIKKKIIVAYGTLMKVQVKKWIELFGLGIMDTLWPQYLITNTNYLFLTL